MEEKLENRVEKLEQIVREIQRKYKQVESLRNGFALKIKHCATATKCGQPLLLDLLNDLSRIHKGAEVYIYDTADHSLFASFVLRDIDYYEQINFNGLVWHYSVEYRTNVPAIIIECDIH